MVRRPNRRSRDGAPDRPGAFVVSDLGGQRGVCVGKVSLELVVAHPREPFGPSAPRGLLDPCSNARSQLGRKRMLLTPCELGQSFSVRGLDAGSYVGRCSDGEFCAHRSDVNTSRGIAEVPRCHFVATCAPVARALLSRAARKRHSERALRRWAGQDSNLRPTDYESAALTAELPALERNLAPPLMPIDPKWSTRISTCAPFASEVACLTHPFLRRERRCSLELSHLVAVGLEGHDLAVAEVVGQLGDRRALPDS